MLGVAFIRWPPRSRPTLSLHLTRPGVTAFGLRPTGVAGFVAAPRHTQQASFPHIHMMHPAARFDALMGRTREAFKCKIQRTRHGASRNGVQPARPPARPPNHSLSFLCLINRRELQKSNPRPTDSPLSHASEYSELRPFRLTGHELGAPSRVAKQGSPAEKPLRAADADAILRAPEQADPCCR
eukprot:363736-Chlamydomonas_euryale.AAC.7